jgi:hypothetical protein
MDWVEEAERRCFGFGRLGLRMTSSLQSDDSNEPGSEGEWMWEEFVGCWVRKSQLSPTVSRVKPVRPRRQPSPTSLTPTPSLSSASESSVPDDDGTISASSYSSPSSPIVIRTRRTTPHSLDTENEPPCPTSPLAPLVPKRPLPRRKSTFESILADSLRNRIVLHPRDTNCPTSVYAPHTPVSKLPRQPIDKACLSSPVWNISSDDTLDLFNHMSSPSRLVS